MRSHPLVWGQAGDLVVSPIIDSLLGARTLLGAPGRTTSNKKSLGAPGLTTRSKDTTGLYSL